MLAVFAVAVYLAVAVVIFRVTLAAGWRRWYNLKPPVGFAAFTALAWPLISPPIVALGFLWHQVRGDYRPKYYEPDHEAYPALLRWARLGRDFYPLGPDRITYSPALVTRKPVA